MTYIFETEHEKYQFRNLKQVQKIVSEAKAVIDDNLLPLIDRAEDGDFKAMRELWNIFVYGSGNANTNYNLAKRYWIALHEQNKLTCLDGFVSHTKADYVFMKYAFGASNEEIVPLATEAIRFIINNEEPKYWDTDRLYRLQYLLDEIFDES